MNFPFKNLQEIESFILVSKKLRQFLNAGVSLNQSLRLLAEDEKNGENKKRYVEAVQRLEKGESFSSVLNLWISFFDFGDTEINIELFLAKIESRYSDKLRQINGLLKALVYPGILMAMMMLLSIIFIFIVLPMTQNFYQDLGYSLPIGLQIVISLGIKVHNYIWEITFFFLLLITLGNTWIKRRFQLIWISIFNPFQVSDQLWKLAVTLESGRSFQQASLKILTPARAEAFSAEKFFSSLPLVNWQKDLLANSTQTETLIPTLHMISEDLQEKNSERLHKIISIVPSIFLVIIGILIFFFLYFTFQPLLTSIKNLNN